MTKLYFIRHGKTVWNAEGRFQGSGGDSPLLPESIDQIADLGNYLSDVTFAHAFTSPIKRAMDTAEQTLAYINNQPELTVLNGLKEFSFGVWEGLTFKEVKQDWLTMYDASRHHPERFDASQVPGAETFEAVQQRFRRAVFDAVNAYGGKDVNLIFFSHGAALTAGMGGLLNIPLANLRDRGGLGNTSTSILETNDGIKFKELIRNDTSYLNVPANASNTI
ncbi:histidine phosphatase family protein [Weissella paramesenteroides]|jgi:broad specificity phosphatase PhoE|uniref:Phosphoglycerate mutase family protein n=2 Tax=Weissella paramesenteroides TaxID=1249 RepID=C5RAF7_WEIPA|nr:histidine phosphatase family protein [Weissella paramesenteroides]ATF40865.1 histidine phosphatase family protein [Weissella paramesenteroides]EER74800.1 phosphoglycerate mutase family protein [Weissella paramesenteroides ATCC 33313]KAA8439073.1 histidine phosphatase family protein [Weissella paramesenteroides]KAA8440219.1 histidine phosphatase family protein [Weissella paramesenteroides]KAA8443870.1 histidine phosphatase family protein [Weissella paramesenteroides]